MSPNFETLAKKWEHLKPPPSMSAIFKLFSFLSTQRGSQYDSYSENLNLWAGCLQAADFGCLFLLAEVAAICFVFCSFPAVGGASTQLAAGRIRRTWRGSAPVDLAAAARTAADGSIVQHYRPLVSAAAACGAPCRGLGEKGQRQGDSHCQRKGRREETLRHASIA